MDTARNSGAEQLRQLLARDSGEAPVRVLSAVNAIAARAAAESGCEALWISGLEVSAATGVPDANVLTVHEMAAVVGAVGAVTALPSIVDIDNAGGSVESARRYGRELWRAGAAAVCLEDSRYPKCNSFSINRLQQLADMELVTDQVREIKDASAGELLVLGRTEALICGASMGEALERAAAFAAAGADIVLVHSKDSTGREALSVAREWTLDVPLAVIPTAFPTLTWGVLGEAGFKMCIYANQLSRAAARAMRLVAQDIMMAGTVTKLEELDSVDAMIRIADPQNAALL